MLTVVTVQCIPSAGGLGRRLGVHPPTPENGDPTSGRDTFK